MTGSRLLKRYLKETGETLSGLSRRCGIDDGYLSRLASGKRRAGRDTAFALDTATGGKVPATSWRKGSAANAT